jgi:hypothetical protein
MIIFMQTSQKKKEKEERPQCADCMRGGPYHTTLAT